MVANGDLGVMTVRRLSFGQVRSLTVRLCWYRVLMNLVRTVGIMIRLVRFRVTSSGVVTGVAGVPLVSCVLSVFLAGGRLNRLFGVVSVSSMVYRVL